MTIRRQQCETEQTSAGYCSETDRVAYVSKEAIQLFERALGEFSAEESSGKNLLRVVWLEERAGPLTSKSFMVDMRPLTGE